MSSDLLRFTTAGSVDDGKSTLIGRMLYDSKQVFEDQLEQVAQASRRRGGEGVLDLALLTDGLRAEREQGITIDVAYRYFASDGSASRRLGHPDARGRRFIIADVPGHKQYTRNMVTGASTADLSIVLIDARRGVLEQSRRHAYISALLRIPHLVVCVNKMDLVDWQQEVFDAIVSDFENFAGLLGVGDVTFIPISALKGDNVVELSEHMDWYAGPTLMGHLETVEVAYDHPDSVPARLPVQWVIRPAEGPEVPTDGGPLTNGHGPPRPADYRGYAGQIASGTLRSGQEVLLAPSGQRTRLAAIDTWDGPVQEAIAPLSVSVRLADELDVSRGEIVCDPDAPPTVARELTATVCWMSERPLRAGERLLVKHATATVQASVSELLDRVDVDTLVAQSAAQALELNDVGRVTLRMSAPLAFDAYRDNRATGCFILIDPASNATVGAGLIEAPDPDPDPGAANH